MKEDEDYRPVTYRELFSNREFRSLYFARLVSLFGDWFNMLAILALLRSMGGSSAGDFGWILILKTLPQVSAAPIAGVIADRFSRKSIMIWSNGIRALIVLGMLSLVWFPSIPVLYVLVIMQSAAASFYEPARSAMLPDVVSVNELTAANAVGAATWSAMLTLGSAAGGVFTAYLGWQPALWVDIASYLIAIVLLWRLREPDWERKQTTDHTSLLDWLGWLDIKEGIVYVWQRPRVLSLMLVKSGWCLAGAITLILTLLGEQKYVFASNAVLGVTILYVARGIGTGLGPFLSRWLSDSEPAAMEKAILWGFLCGACFYFLLPFAPNIWIASLIIICAHLGGSTIWVFSTVRLQQILPSIVRGRVFAAQQASFTVMISLSTFVYGWIFDQKWLTLRQLVFCIGGTLLIPVVLWALRGWRYGWAQTSEPV